MFMSEQNADVSLILLCCQPPYFVELEIRNWINSLYLTEAIQQTVQWNYENRIIQSKAQSQEKTQYVFIPWNMINHREGRELCKIMLKHIHTKLYWKLCTNDIFMFVIIHIFSSYENLRNSNMESADVS